MKIPGWIPKSIHLSLSAKRDALLLPALFLFNCFVFSTWFELGNVATKPWLLLVWLYGLAMLVPLAWRDRAPVTVFISQCVLTVAAWPIMPLYIPVAGISLSLYAVSVHRSRKISLLALLASFIPSGLAVAALFKVNSDPGELIIFIANAVIARHLGREWLTSEQIQGHMRIGLERLLQQARGGRIGTVAAKRGEGPRVGPVRARVVGICG